MFRRLLFDPDPNGNAGGTGSPAPASTPPPAKPAGEAKPTEATAPPPTPGLPPEIVRMLGDLQSRVTTYEQAERDRTAALEAERIKGLADKGKTDEVIASLNKRYDEDMARLKSTLTDAETRFKTTLRDKELASALAGLPLTGPGAAKHLAILLRDELEVVEAGDGFTVRSRDHRSVTDFVKAKLTDPDYEHFIKPSGGAGTGAEGGNRAATTAEATTAEAQAIAAWQAREQQSQSAGYAAKGLFGRPRARARPFDLISPHPAGTESR